MRACAVHVPVEATPRRPNRMRCGWLHKNRGKDENIAVRIAGPGITKAVADETHPPELDFCNRAGAQSRGTRTSSRSTAPREPGRAETCESGISFCRSAPD